MTIELILITTPHDKLSFIDSCIKDLESSNKHIVLFGRNVFAKFLIDNFNISAIVDEYSDDKNYLDIPLIKLNDIQEDSLVIVLSGGQTLTSMNKVKSKNLPCIHYFSLFKHASIDLPAIPFEGNTEQAYTSNKGKFEHVYSRLYDQKSREQFRKVISFRVNLDVEIMKGFSTREDEQYFEDFLELQPAGESFVDIGAYDGFTTESFIQLCPNYTSIDIFEPDPENLTLAKTRLNKYQNITYHQLGLADRVAEVNFETGGSTASISNSGSSKIQLNCLDNLINTSVSFIKMDIEGAEIKALNGATRVISEYHPRLAIATYHNPDHFWQIPEIILSIRDDYDIYFRHYTESLYESVLFFIPRKPK